MNKLLSVRIPKKLLCEMEYMVKVQGYTHQELIRESLREFIWQKKQKDFMKLVGSKKGISLTKKQRNQLAKELYG